MLVSDNFVHADLHPGNILIKRPPDARKTWQGWFQDVFGMGRYPKLILLDAGMVTELAPQDQFKLVGFFKALTERDGENIAQSILSLSEQPLCPVGCLGQHRLNSSRSNNLYVFLNTYFVCSEPKRFC